MAKSMKVIKSEVFNSLKGGKVMKEKTLQYNGPKFTDIKITPVKYEESYFQLELDLESDLFYELRKKHNITPFRINESSAEELAEIKEYFNKNKDTFYFLFDGDKNLIGCIFFHENFIQSLCIDRKYQRKGYGSQLTKFAVNQILAHGYNDVVLKVLDGNDAAMKLYFSLGFRVIQ